MTWACEGDGCVHSRDATKPVIRTWCSTCTEYCTETGPCTRGEHARHQETATAVRHAAHRTVNVLNRYLGTTDTGLEWDLIQDELTDARTALEEALNIEENHQ